LVQCGNKSLSGSRDGEKRGGAYNEGKKGCWTNDRGWSYWSKNEDKAGGLQNKKMPRHVRSKRKRRENWQKLLALRTTQKIKRSDICRGVRATGGNFQGVYKHVRE